MTARAIGVRRASRKRSDNRLLPAGVNEFLRRRSVEALGVALALLALAILVASVTYTPSDPSFNNAVEGVVDNALGLAGAYFSDLLLQVLGLAGFLLPFALIGWGWRLVRRRDLRRWPLRLMALAGTLFFAAFTLASLPSPGHWPISSGLGGAIGNLAYTRVTIVAGNWAWLLVPLTGLGAIALFFYVLDFTRKDLARVRRLLTWFSVPEPAVAPKPAGRAAKRATSARKEKKQRGRREPILEEEEEEEARRSNRRRVGQRRQAWWLGRKMITDREQRKRSRQNPKKATRKGGWISATAIAISCRPFLS